MKKTKILYWVFTGLFSFMMFGSAIPDVVSSEIAIKGRKRKYECKWVGRRGSVCLLCSRLRSDFDSYLVSKSDSLKFR